MKSVCKIDYSQLASALPRECDLFICCASFEERCRTFADNLDSTWPKSVLIVHNGAISPQIAVNARHLQTRFGDRARIVDVPFSDPIATEDCLTAQLSQFIADRAAARVLVDITTFNRESLLILINQLHRLLRAGDQVTFAYTGAASYGTDETEPDKIWLTRGIRDVRSLLGYAGRILPSRKTHLILLVGFETERVSALISSYEPSVLSLGYGPKEHSITPKHHELNVLFHQKISSLYEGVHQFVFPPNDPIGTRDAVLAQAAIEPEMNIVLASLNTKLSTLGVALAAFSDPRMQLCYAEAAIYNFDHYAKAGVDCYVFDGTVFIQPPNPS